MRLIALLALFFPGHTIFLLLLIFSTSQIKELSKAAYYYLLLFKTCGEISKRYKGGQDNFMIWWHFFTRSLPLPVLFHWRQPHPFEFPSDPCRRDGAVMRSAGDESLDDAGEGAEEVEVPGYLPESRGPRVPVNIESGLGVIVLLHEMHTGLAGISSDVTGRVPVFAGQDFIITIDIVTLVGELREKVARIRDTQ